MVYSKESKLIKIEIQYKKHGFPKLDSDWWLYLRDKYLKLCVIIIICMYLLYEDVSEIPFSPEFYCPRQNIRHYITPESVKNWLMSQWYFHGGLVKVLFMTDE